MSNEKLARIIMSKTRKNMIPIFYNKEQTLIHKITQKLKLSKSPIYKNLRLLYYLEFINFEN